MSNAVVVAPTDSADRKRAAGHRPGSEWHHLGIAGAAIRDHKFPQLAHAPGFAGAVDDTGPPYPHSTGDIGACGCAHTGLAGGNLAPQHA
jgi:hypothetical protein